MQRTKAQKLRAEAQGQKAPYDPATRSRPMARRGRNPLTGNPNSSVYKVYKSPITGK